MSRDERSTNDIMVVAGEPSGDVHAANLVKALYSAIPALQLSGMGGQLMAEAGVDLIHDIGDISITGFGGIPRIYPKLRKIKKDLLRKISNQKPKAVIFRRLSGIQSFMRALGAQTAATAQMHILHHSPGMGLVERPRPHHCGCF